MGPPSRTIGTQELRYKQLVEALRMIENTPIAQTLSGIAQGLYNFCQSCVIV